MAQRFISRNEFIERFGRVPSERSIGVELTNSKGETRLWLFWDDDGETWAINELERVWTLDDPRKHKHGNK